MVQNLPCNAGDVGPIPGGDTKIPRASEPLKPVCSGTPVLQLERVHGQQRGPGTAKHKYNTFQKIFLNCTPETNTTLYSNYTSTTTKKVTANKSFLLRVLFSRLVIFLLLLDLNDMI